MGHSQALNICNAVSIFLPVFSRCFPIFPIYNILAPRFITSPIIKPLLNYATRQIQSLLNINAPDWFPIVQWLGVMKLDICVSVIISAVLGKMVLSGLSAGGSMRKVHFGGGKD